MAVSVSLINMKGGVGKTTLAVQLAHACDQKNLRVLAVDLDPQANLSQVLMTPEQYAKHLQKKRPTIVQVFEQYSPPTNDTSSPRRIDIREIIVKVGFWSDSTLHLIPSRLELAHVLKNPKGKERRLARALGKVAADYDLILIDCAPTESMLSQAAYHSSRYALVPVKPEFLATIGLPLLARSVRDFKGANGDHAIDICGDAFNHSSSYSHGPEVKRAIREVRAEAKKHSWHIYNTQVRYSRSYAKASREGTPIGSTSYVRWNVTAEFTRFVQEFLKSIGLSREDNS